MDDNNKYDVSDLVVSALEQRPLDFENAFNDLIIGRLQTQIQDKKIAIAQQMYGYEPEAEAEPDYTEEE